MEEHAATKRFDDWIRRTRSRLLVLLAIMLVTSHGSAAETSSKLEQTPFASGPNAAALEQLANGKTVMRSTAAGTLTPDDKARMRALGFRKLDSGVVVLHRIGPLDEAKIVARVRMLATSVEGFAPSGACDGIVSEGEGIGLCTGSVDGPVGRIPVRMPVAVSFAKAEGGVLRLAIRNRQALQAKALFSWTSVVDPDHVKVVYELYPHRDGWLVYTRVAIEMRSHESSAKTISDTLVKLDSWLTSDLARL